MLQTLNKACLDQDQNLIRSCLIWSYWNLGHNEWKEVLNLRRQQHQKLIDLIPLSVVKKNLDEQVLPWFVADLGHTGFLFLNAASNKRWVKRIYLPKTRPANAFYWKLVQRRLGEVGVIVDEFENLKKEHSPLVALEEYFQVNSEAKVLYSHSAEVIDENEDHGNLFPSSSLKLEVSEKIYDLGAQWAQRCLGQSNKVIILHVRESFHGVDVNSQARDASVESYWLACKYLKENGYVVVRMGSKKMPALSHRMKSLVFDYAHYAEKEDWIDCWLWSECIFWIGNSCGPLPVLRTFEKPLVFTNSWMWNLVGSTQDLILPKVLSKNGKVVSATETISSGLSRTQNRKLIEAKGYKLIDNPSEVIKDSVVEMVYKLDEKFSVDCNNTLDSVTKDFMTALGIRSRRNVAKLSESFKQFFSSNMIYRN